MATKKQLRYSIKQGYKQHFDKLEKPDYLLKNYITETTISGRINEAVKIAVSDFIKVKSELLDKEMELERVQNELATLKKLLANRQQIDIEINKIIN